MVNYTKENPLKVFTAFSGYDSQCLALKRLGIDFDLVGWSEIDKAAITAHNALFPEYAERNYGDISKIDWSQVPDFDLFTYSSPCVTGDTIVDTTVGPIAMKELVEKYNNGEELYVFSVAFGSINIVRINKITFAGLTRKNAKVIKLNFSNGKSLKCTPDHKIAISYNTNPHHYRIEFKDAQNLTTDDIIVSTDDNYKSDLKPTYIVSIEECENEDVYDITVERGHNFYANGILVHNCTDFSNAGLQKGGEEGSGTRSSLLWECRKTILAKKPKYLMLENVAALVSDKFLYLFEKWCRELEEYGYVNFYQVLNAKDYGVPQSRSRIFMISILKTEDDPNPYYEFPKPIKLEKCVEDVLEDGPADSKYYMKQEVADNYVQKMMVEYPDNVGLDIVEEEGLW